jgi:hypothetical protein
MGYAAALCLHSPGAWLPPRPLTSDQMLLLALCDGRMMTLADLAKAPRQPAEDIAHALAFLCKHALVRRL